MKPIPIIILVIVLISAIFTGIYFVDEDNIDDAIAEYEDGDYVDALKMLNELGTLADYETGEKIYYYRCKAINRLAAQLEEDYDDEIKEISEIKDNDSKRKKLRHDLQRMLDEVNEKVKGDLSLIADKKRDRILSRGKLYNEFVSKYNGSRLIEDLDFEEVEKIERTEAHKLLAAIAGFYSRYPNTAYIAQLVKMLFRSLKKSAIQIKGKEDFLKKLIIQFGRRYPSSSEFHRLFVCTGDNVNLRNSPGTNGAIVGKIAHEAILIQLEKTMDTFQVGDTRDYWYRISNLKGLQGWIFGKFLAPLDIAKFPVEEKKEVWSFEDSFTDWTDSNTPKNWIHVADSDSTAIGFSSRAGTTIVKLNSLEGKSSGLYRRAVTTKSFSLLARARYIKGSLTLFAYVLSGQKVYSVILSDELVRVSGRKIPVQTSDWHEYKLESTNGRFARLSIDGEIISSRIEPVSSSAYKMAGVYCLHSTVKEFSLAEMEYIKIR